MQSGFHKTKVSALGYQAANEFLIKGRDLSESVAELCHSENQEVVKRVCEAANNQVYLTLFNRPGADRVSISYKPATTESVLAAIPSQDSAMGDYNETPKDYRQTKTAGLTEIAHVDASNAKRDIMQKLATAKSKLEMLGSCVTTMKVASEREAEIEIVGLHKMARNMVIGGDSLGDIAKIACRSTHELGMDQMKVASAMSYIGEEIKKEGLRVDENFTKISSMPVCHDHAINKSAYRYALCIEKIAGFDSMLEGIADHISEVENVIEKADRL